MRLRHRFELSLGRKYSLSRGLVSFTSRLRLLTLSSLVDCSLPATAPLHSRALNSPTDAREPTRAPITLGAMPHHPRVPSPCVRVGVAHEWWMELPTLENKN